MIDVANRPTSTLARSGAHCQPEMHLTDQAVYPMGRGVRSLPGGSVY